MSIYDLRFTIVKFKQQMKPPDAVKIKERKWIWLNEMHIRPHPSLLPEEKEQRLTAFYFAEDSSANPVA
jgi:hypothetical protein